MWKSKKKKKPRQITTPQKGPPPKKKNKTKTKQQLQNNTKNNKKTCRIATKTAFSEINVWIEKAISILLKLICVLDILMLWMICI